MCFWKLHLIPLCAQSEERRGSPAAAPINKSLCNPGSKWIWGFFPSADEFWSAWLSWTTSRPGFEQGFARKTKLTPVTFLPDCMHRSSPSSKFSSLSRQNPGGLKTWLSRFCMLCFLFLISCCWYSFLLCTFCRLLPALSPPAVFIVETSIAVMCLLASTCDTVDHNLIPFTQQSEMHKSAFCLRIAEITADSLQLCSLSTARMQDCPLLPAGQGFKLLVSSAAAVW